MQSKGTIYAYLFNIRTEFYEINYNNLSSIKIFIHSILTNESNDE